MLTEYMYTFDNFCVTINTRIWCNFTTNAWWSYVQTYSIFKVYLEKLVQQCFSLTTPINVNIIIMFVVLNWTCNRLSRVISPWIILSGIFHIVRYYDCIKVISILLQDSDSKYPCFSEILLIFDQQCPLLLFFF